MPEELSVEPDHLDNLATKLTTLADGNVQAQAYVQKHVDLSVEEAGPMCCERTFRHTLPNHLGRARNLDRSARPLRRGPRLLVISPPVQRRSRDSPGVTWSSPPTNQMRTICTSKSDSDAAGCSESGAGCSAFDAEG